MTVAIRYAVRSDKGLVRGNNEDSVYAGPRLIAIADGMGGHAGGEIASKIVIGALEELDEDRKIEDLITALRDAVEDANESLSLQVVQDPNLDGMGTTLTALRFSGSKIGLVHVGDSRGYLLRDGSLSQITHDDTYVQSLVDAGRLTSEEAMHHPRKSVILRALNGTEVEPDVSIREAIIGDRYLLCSDGLTDVVRPETIREALGEGDPQDCADRLVALALRGGGPDNVTVVIADVVPSGHGDDLPVAAGAVVDPGEETADDDSPAARASALDGKGPTPRLPQRRERRWPRVIVPLVILVVLVGGAFATWVWTQSQYFVGRSQGVVAVFKGVDTAIGPLRFYSVVDRSGLRVLDLIPAARTQVADGITANSRADADAIVARLADGQLLPVCSTPTPTPSPSTLPSSPTTAPTKPTSRTTRTPVSRPPTRRATTARAVPSRTTKSVTAPVSTPTLAVTPTPTPSLSPSTIEPTAEPSVAPSVDPSNPTCRESPR